MTPAWVTHPNHLRVIQTVQVTMLQTRIPVQLTRWAYLKCHLMPFILLRAVTRLPVRTDRWPKDDAWVSRVIPASPSILLLWYVSSAVCEGCLLMPWLHVKWHYFSLRQRSTEIILFQPVETCLKLFQNCFWGLLQLVNIFQHVQCCWNILKQF